MDPKVRKIELVETRSRYDMKTGAPLALAELVYKVDGHMVVVAVTYAATYTLEGGQLSPEEVELAARTYIKMETEREENWPLKGTLILDEGAMIGRVAERLGWKGRFCSIA